MSAVVVSLSLTADGLVARVLSSKSVPEQYQFCFILFCYTILFSFSVFILLLLFLLLVTSFHHVFPLKKYMLYISQL